MRNLYIILGLALVALIGVAVWTNWGGRRFAQPTPAPRSQTSPAPRSQTNPAPRSTTPAPPTPPTTETAKVWKDTTPNGCVDCHKVKEGKDYTLNAMTRRIQGHPTVQAKTVKECMTCHAEGSFPFRKVLHVKHLKNNIFIDKYKGNCLNCHKMAQSGEIVVKGLEG
ncbi:MAG: hypothetical protein M1379_14195 [Firmicutes bacterium]|nr:hypothetical protein [Bacillota bacterium]